jgi:predicted GH43/DUF377 family glycosyl hydrolase
LGPRTSGEKRLTVKTWRRDEVDVSDPRFAKADVVDDAVMNHLRPAWSEDGVHLAVEETPILEGGDPLANLGINDPRALYLDGEYKITYTANSLWASTRGWRPPRSGRRLRKRASSLLDLQDPSQVMARSAEPLMEP